MNIKPMIFNTEMVRALLDGRKVQTRRPVKVSEGWELKDQQICRVIEPKKGPWGVMQRRAVFIDGRYMHEVIPAPAMTGDLIYVRETFRLFDSSNECGCSDAPCGCPRTGTPIYFSDCSCSESKWTPSIHMSRWASRLTLKVTGVRVERVQDISETDAVKEGFEGWDDDVTGGCTAFGEFSQTWCGIYGEESWNRNDWVWVIDFEVIRQNVDEYLKEQEHAA